MITEPPEGMGANELARLVDDIASLVPKLDSEQLMKLERATRSRRMVLGPHKISRDAPVGRKRKRLHRATPEEISAALAQVNMERDLEDLRKKLAGPADTSLVDANQKAFDRDFAPTSDHKTYVGDVNYKGKWYRKSILRSRLEGGVFTVVSAGKLYGHEMVVEKVNKTKASCRDVGDGKVWSVPLQHLLDAYLEGTFK